jgi:hypothetical protein
MNAHKETNKLANLEIEHRVSAPGAWVRGKIGIFSFVALVFSEHAENPNWEIGQSRISKLWLQRLTEARAVYNWDRGMDLPAADEQAAAAVKWLTTHLADHVFRS